MIHISQNELASLVGATRETTSTTLNALARQGLIALGHRLVMIPSLELLRDTRLIPLNRPRLSADHKCERKSQQAHRIKVDFSILYSYCNCLTGSAMKWPILFLAPILLLAADDPDRRTIKRQQAVDRERSSREFGLQANQ